MVLGIEGEVHVQINPGQPLGGEEIGERAQDALQGCGAQEGQGVGERTLRRPLDPQEPGLRQIRDAGLDLQQRDLLDATALGRDGEALIVEVHDTLKSVQPRPVGIEVQGHVLDPQQDLKVSRPLAEGKIPQPPLEQDQAPGHPASGKGTIQPGPRPRPEMGIRQIIADARRRGVQDLAAQIQLRRGRRQSA